MRYCSSLTELEQIDVMRIQLHLFVRNESDAKRTYCAFYLISDSEGGFIVSSALISENYDQVCVF